MFVRRTITGGSPTDSVDPGLRRARRSAEDDIVDVFGLPRKPRPIRIPAPEVNVQQIHIHGDNLGVINTGTVGSISNNLTVIQRT
jgi:hypothetical protein